MEYLQSHLTNSMPPRKQSTENIMGKGENAGNQHFLLFFQCFLPYHRCIAPFQAQ